MALDQLPRPWTLLALVGIARILYSPTLLSQLLQVPPPQNSRPRSGASLALETAPLIAGPPVLHHRKSPNHKAPSHHLLRFSRQIFPFLRLSRHRRDEIQCHGSRALRSKRRSSHGLDQSCLAKLDSAARSNKTDAHLRLQIAHHMDP